MKVVESIINLTWNRGLAGCIARCSRAQTNERIDPAAEFGLDPLNEAHGVASPGERAVTRDVIEDLQLKAGIVSAAATASQFLISDVPELYDSLGSVKSVSSCPLLRASSTIRSISSSTTRWLKAARGDHGYALIGVPGLIARPSAGRTPGSGVGLAEWAHRTC